MIMTWLRENVYASGVLLLVRLYLGWEWMIAGWEKIAGEKAFDATGFLTNVVNNPVASRAGEVYYPNFNLFIESFAMPNIGIINFLIPWGELLVGIGLLLGALTTAAMFFGLTMNFMFMFAGTISSNPWMTLLGFFIIAAGANAGRFGADYVLLSYLRKLVARKKEGTEVPRAF